MRSYLLIAALGAVLVGCEPAKSTTNPPVTPPATGTASTPAAKMPPAATDAGKAIGAVVAAAQQVEIGCLKCIHKTGTACAPAVKVGDKILTVSGGNLDAHAFCAAPKKATIEGKIEGDKFVATKVQLAP